MVLLLFQFKIVGNQFFKDCIWCGKKFCEIVRITPQHKQAVLHQFDTPRFSLPVDAHAQHIGNTPFPYMQRLGKVVKVDIFVSDINWVEEEEYDCFLLGTL